MKRIITALSLVLTLAITSSFAADVKVSASVMQTFKSRFADAQNVIWSQANGFTIAEFTQDETKQFAYFNTAGDLAVVAEPLAVTQLSKAQQSNLRKAFADYTVTDVYKLQDEEGSKYFAVVENSSKKLILNTTSSKWDIVKTTNR
jgi:hypothetical protein